jgi:hypothetical protein
VTFFRYGKKVTRRRQKKELLLGKVGQRRHVPYRKRSDQRKIVRRGQKRAGKVCRRKRER